MEASGGGRWSQEFLRHTAWDAAWGVRQLLEDAEAAYRQTAARLRASGNEDMALRAEQFAAWARFELNEPQAAQRLYSVTKELRDVPRFRLPGKVLDGALSLAGADRGNVQVVDPATGSLRIIAQRGFDPDFLGYFAVVDDDGSACGRTAMQGTQTVIVDVNTDPGFAPHREIAAASGFRAVQSTPLVDRSGRLFGVVSTHYPRPYRPSGRDLQIMKRYGELVGQTMAIRPHT